MALSTATITYDVSDQVGTDFDIRRTKVWVSTNIADGTVIDTVGNAIRVDTGQGTLAADGTGSVTVWTPGTGSNPDSWQTYVHLDYASPMDRTRKRRTFGPFTVTTAANLADLVEEQEVPAEYLTTITAALQVLVDDAETAVAEAEAAVAEAEAAEAAAEAAEAAAEAAQAAAEAARDDAIDISGIATPDAVVAALAVNEASATFAAISEGFPRVFTPQAYGAVGDGVADDTTAILAAVAAGGAAGGGTVFFPPGEYLCRLVRVNASNITFRGAGDATLVYRSSGAAVTDGLLCWGDQAAVGGTSLAGNFSNILIEGLAFEGTGSTGGLIENQGLISASGVSNFAVRDCTFSDMQGDGITIQCTQTANTERHNSNVTIENNLFDGIANYGRQALSVIEGASIHFRGNRCYNIAAPTMPGAVDIEPNTLNTWGIIRDISVTDNLFDNCGGGVGDVCVVFPNASFTNGTPAGITFARNVHLNSNASAWYVSWLGHAATSADDHLGISIRDSFVRGSGANYPAPLSYVNGVRGVTIQNNVVVDWTSYIGLVGLASSTSVDAVDYIDNMFLNCGVAVGPMIQANTHTNLAFSRNRVSRATSSISALIANVTSGTSSGMKILENDCTGATVSALSTVGGTHTTTAAGNRARGNINTPAPNVAIFAAAPSVTGSRASNPAVASLLTAFANAGYIQDDSSASAVTDENGIVRTMVSGRYYGPVGVVPDATAVGSGVATVVPLWVPPSGVTVSAISCEVTTAGAGDLRMGIYASDASDQPSALVLDAGVLTGALGSTGVKEITGLTQLLGSGLYWLCVAPQNTASGSYRTCGAAARVPVAAATFIGSNGAFGMNGYNMAIAAALPATFVPAGAVTHAALCKIKAA